MSKLTQIEKALHSIDQANFQRLCDSYLFKRGYEHINTIGLVTGADKVAKGSPDTLNIRSDGKYDFAEYSTQQGRLASKFADDLAKCFDEDKTGIPETRINEIVLCHNAHLTTEEHYDLTEQCRVRGILLSIYGPGTIAHDLYQKYPGLAKDFLGVDVDTGQIVTTDDFILAYNKRSFTTRLDTVFRFRDEELKQVARVLEDKGLALISGRPGIGKTRFALECCARYLNEHSDAKVFCIFNKGADLFEDLRVYLSEPGHFLIFVDDANRLSGFKYVLQFLHDQRQDQKLKIIATVRDYALESVEKAAKRFGSGVRVELDQFKGNQLKELVRENSKIDHPLYLNRITRIAQGNPRLAMMAAQVVERENDLQSIADVSALYDEYFASIRDDLEDFGNTLILVAGIIAFFRIVDRSNSEMMAAIIDNFKIDAETFWQTTQRLHELEVVDIYENNDLIKASDQVLSTYLFYLAAFRKRTLNLGILLDHFLPDFHYRLVDALHSVRGAFDLELITNILRPHVKRVCDIAQQQSNQDKILYLLDVFWFVNPTDTLIYLQDKIDEMETQPVPWSNLTFAVGDNFPSSHSVLRILENFRYGDETEFKPALSLVLDYLEKRPAELPIVLRLLQGSYGINHYSHLNEFLVERQTADAVWTRAQDGKNEFFLRVFLTMAEPLLRTHIPTLGEKPLRENDPLPVSKALLDFRKELWQRIFLLYSFPAFREEVLDLIRKHSHSRSLVADKEIIASDSDQVLAFFQGWLQPALSQHCIVVQDYIYLLKWVGLKPQQDLRERFTNETSKVYELLLSPLREKDELGLQEYITKRRQCLDDYLRYFDESEFERFFERCAEIIPIAKGLPYKDQVQELALAALLNLAERDDDLFTVVLENYLHSGNIFNLEPGALAHQLIQACGGQRAYEILSSGRYLQHKSWLFEYFKALPENAVTSDHVQQLYALYESAKWNEVLPNVDYLLKFVPLDKHVFVRVVGTLVTRCMTEPKFGYALNGLFSDHSEVGHRLRELFAGEENLLKRAYFAANEDATHKDLDGNFFNILLDMDSNFCHEWILQLPSRVDSPIRRDDSRDYSFIWRRHDFIRVMEHIVDAICSCGDYSYLEIFFTSVNSTENIDALQDEFLFEVIRRRSKDEVLMKALFGIISGLSTDRQKPMFEAFIHNNKGYGMFKCLLSEWKFNWDLNFHDFEDSAVPGLQAHGKFLESLLPIFNTVDLLRHRQLIDSLIQQTRTGIEIEKQRDFMRDQY